MPQHSNHRSPRRWRQKEGHEKTLEEIIVENFPKMRKEIANQVPETQRVPNRIIQRWNTPRHILIKLTKIKHKEQILKAAREKQQITYKEILMVFLFVFFFWDSYDSNVGAFNIVPEVSEVVFICLKKFFFPLWFIYFYHSIFYLTNPIFCLHYSTSPNL